MATGTAKPAWFNLEEYTTSQKLEFDDWAFLLNCREELRSLIARANFPDADTPIEELRADLNSRWNTYLNDAAPARYQQRKAQGELDPLALIPHPFPIPIQDVTSTFLRGRAQRDRLAKLEVGMTGARVLLVDSTLPEDELKASFEKWLFDERRRDPPPISRRGPKPSTTRITNDHLASWGHHKVLAVLDLDLWARLADEKVLSHQSLAILLGADPRVDAKEWGRAARAKAKEALAATDLIGMQARRGGPK